MGYGRIPQARKGTMASEKSKVIDSVLMGALIRRRRQQLGINRAEDFVALMKKYTGCDISLQTMYNIEQGRSELKLSVYLAITRVLFYDTAHIYDKFVKLTLPEGWDEALGIDLMNRGLINEFKRDLELAQAGMFAGSADAERSIDTRREPLPF